MTILFQIGPSASFIRTGFEHLISLNISNCQITPIVSSSTEASEPGAIQYPVNCHRHNALGYGLHLE